VRFCPFCSAENADELAVCQSCGRRLPPLPPRRARNAPPTGVQLPPRPATTTSPPPVPRRPPTPPPPPPIATATATATVPPPARAVHERQALLDAITPGPAAQRREPPPADGDVSLGRRASDATMPATAQGTPAPRFKPPTQPPPPPARAHRVSEVPPLPPPGPHAPPAPVDPTSAGPLLATPTPPVPAYPMVRSHGSADTDPIVAAARVRSDASPPPTRIQRADGTERPFTPPKVDPVPEIPEPGLLNAARYAIHFGKARWQRRGAIKTLGAEIKQDTEALDQVLGALGREARDARVEGRVFSAENAAISAAEDRVAQLGKEHGDVDARKADEHSRFVDIERERNAKLAEAERLVDEASKELAHLEGQRRALRDKRKEFERRQKAYLKGAEDRDRDSGIAQTGDARAELRRAAEGLRKEAAALEPERQDIDRRLAALERPIGEATAKLDAAKAELDAAKRSLHDAREGHNHRLAELDAEQKRKNREIALAEAEIQRRLVTLGTLVNLNRIEDPAFAELYQRIDRIRGAITARTTEIEKLTAEREAYDRSALVRGISTIGGAIVLFIALIAILRAAL
jgi:hypothetical protein